MWRALGRSVTPAWRLPRSQTATSRAIEVHTMSQQAKSGGAILPLSDGMLHQLCKSGTAPPAMQSAARWQWVGCLGTCAHVCAPCADVLLVQLWLWRLTAANMQRASCSCCAATAGAPAQSRA